MAGRWSCSLAMLPWGTHCCTPPMYSEGQEGHEMPFQPSEDLLRPPEDLYMSLPVLGKNWKWCLKPLRRLSVGWRGFLILRRPFKASREPLNITSSFCCMLLAWWVWHGCGGFSLEVSHLRMPLGSTVSRNATDLEIPGVDPGMSAYKQMLCLNHGPIPNCPLAHFFSTQ